MASNKTAPAQPPAAVPMTTVHGYALQILGFIPIPKGDLKKQSEIPMLLLDIQEGRKSLDAIIPYIKEPEFRQQHVGKRFEASQLAAWKEADDKAAAKLKAEAESMADVDLSDMTEVDE